MHRDLGSKIKDRGIKERLVVAEELQPSPIGFAIQRSQQSVHKLRQHLRVRSDRTRRRTDE